MKNILLVLTMCLAFFSCQAKNKTVHLKGELKDFASEFMMSKGTPKAQLLKEGVEITLDAENKFDITFELDAPAYFKLGRNTLYLTPGDQLEVVADGNPMSAKFVGSCSEVCDYLKARPFPKAGSYLYGTDVMKDNPTKEEVGERVKKEVLARQAKLSALENVSEKFTKMENARILFDAANTLISYCRGQAYANMIPKEEMASYVADLKKLYQNDIDKYVSIGHDKDYLNLGVFLNISDECIRVIGEDKMDQEILDFLKTYELVMNLGYEGPVADVLTAKVEVLKELKLEQYKAVVTKAFEKYDIIMPGELAADLNMKNREGKQVKLSDYRGQFVVIDVWATWCGPCIKESPFFEKLAAKYKENKNIKFVAISIDTNIKAWEKYLDKHEKVSDQLNCNRMEFEKYVLQGVPRFMVIDKEGKIVDVFAPVPSNPEFEKVIKKVLR